MGISKAKGFAWSKKYLGLNGSVIVITGDGEFQEDKYLSHYKLLLTKK